ncbi:MAG: hypothetical protein KDD45_11310 [Bdellovibrionales bacterium]|nr:hypothetical protein [Bdellovibrionales bacterium]
MTLDLHQDFLLVGDLVDVVTGMEVPADCILIQASDLTTDESAMTGETDPIRKTTLKECIIK